MTVDEAAILAGAHPHGYLLVAEPTTDHDLAGTDRGPTRARLPDDVAGWRVEEGLLPGATLLLQPRTLLASASGATGVVVLLGHPVDVEAGIIDPHRIAGRLRDVWDRSGEQALVAQAAYLGGRWTLIAGRRVAPAGSADAASADAAELIVVPDTMASQAIFLGVDQGRDLIALASSASLTAGVLGADPDAEALALLATLRSRGRGRTTYLPGYLTAFQGVRPQLPNSLSRLTVRAGACAVEQERFWPRTDRVETTDVDAVYDEFRDRLLAHVTLLAQFGRPAVSLTAGLDSRITAAAAAGALRARDGFAFTYLNPRDAVNGTAAADDVLGANAVAARLGIPHRVLHWRQPPEGGTFDVLHRRTYAPRLPSRGAAHAMWADLPGDLIQLQSNGAEVGTTFIKTRRDDALTPQRLMEMLMQARRGAHDDLAEQAYGGYLEAASFTLDRLHGYDHHDVFYWEQRMGRWGWQKFVDGDFGHRILLPFNDRVLLETMHRLPYPLRRDKVLFSRLFEDVPQVQLTTRTEPTRPRLERAVLARLPGTIRGKVDRSLSERRRQQALADLTWPGGYALVPLEEARRHQSPRGWPSTVLPGGQMRLVGHPGLARATVGDAQGWVLVLGEPADLPSGASTPSEVATVLLGLLHEDPELALTRACALVGSWVVVLAGPQGSVLVTDPLLSLGARVGGRSGSRAVFSHESLARRWIHSGTVAVRSGDEQILRVDGLPGTSPWRVEDAAPERAALARYASDLRVGRTARLQQHAAVLAARGPAVLALADAVDGRDADLVALGAVLPGTTAITWWDRTDQGRTKAMLRANGAAMAAGIPHRIVPVREATADHRGPSAPGHGLQALMRTWDQDPEAEELPAPLGDTVNETLPEDTVIWFGSHPGPTLAPTPRSMHLVQGVRQVALPFADRILDLLPEGEALSPR